MATRLKGLNASLAEAAKKNAEFEAQVTASQRDLSAGESVLRREDRGEIVAMGTRAGEMHEELLQAEKGYTTAYIRLDPRLRAVQESLAALEPKIDDSRMRSEREALSEGRTEVRGRCQSEWGNAHPIHCRVTSVRAPARPEAPV